MADNEELNFGQMLDNMEQQQKNGENIDEAINNLFAGLSQRTSFDDLDLDTIGKLFNLIEGKSLTAEQQDIFSKIIERQTELTRQQPTNDTPANDRPDPEPKPQPKQPETIVLGADEPKVSPNPQPEPIISPETVFDFDNMTSYDLKQEYMQALADYNDFQKRLEQNEDDESAKAHAKELHNKLIAIVDYVKKEIDETDLSYEDPDTGEKNLLPHNAPTVSDYVEILEAAGYEYKDYDTLNAAMAEFDHINGLDGKLPSAEKIEENVEAWRNLLQNGEDLPPIPEEFNNEKTNLEILKSIDAETYEDINYVINTAVITQLATEKPNKNTEKAKKRYDEVYKEVAQAYFGTVSTTLAGIANDKEQQKMWWDKFSKAHNPSLDNSDETKLRYDAQFKAFMLSEVYKTVNCTFAQNNAIYASRLAQISQAKQTLPIAAKLKEYMKKNPDIMQAVKKGGKVCAAKALATIGFGVVGATAAQAWQMIDTFKKEISNCKKENGGKFSLKFFSKYLKKNPEALINLAKNTLLFTTAGIATAALVASGAATFGLTGVLAGAVATNVAGGVAVKGLKYAVSTGITAVTGIATAYITKRKIKPKKAELMEILRQHFDEAEQQPAKKGFFARFKKDNSKSAQAYRDLTKIFKNGDNTLEQKIKDYGLENQKEQIMQLAKEIKALKLKRNTIVASTAIGSTATALFIDTGHDTPNTDTDAANTDGTTPTNLTSEQGTPGQETPEQDTQATEPANSAELHTLPAESFEKRGDMWYATQMGPSVMEEKLRAMGFAEEMDKLPRHNGAIPSRIMAEYLKTTQFSEDQMKELQDFVKRDNIDAEIAKFKALHNNWHTIGNGTSVAVHTQGNLGNDGNVATEAHTPAAPAADDVATPETPTAETPATDTNSAEQAQQTITVTGRAKKDHGLLNLFYKKHEYTIEIPQSGHLNSDVENYAGNIAMQEYNAKHPEAPITDPAELKKHGYSITGRFVDPEGKEHTFKVKYTDDGNRMIRTIDGERTEVRNVGGNHIAKYSKVELPANTVGGEGTKPDRVIIAIQDSSGKGTFVKDGDTGEIHKVVVDQNGQTHITKTDLTESQVKAIYRNYGKTR